jgi:hypothetical protein
MASVDFSKALEWIRQNTRRHIPDGRNFQVMDVRVGWLAYHATGGYTTYLVLSNQPNGFTNF